MQHFGAPVAFLLPSQVVAVTNGEKGQKLIAHLQMEAASHRAASA